MHKHSIVTTSLVALLALSGCNDSNETSPVVAKSLDISIIHVNDQHSHIASENTSFSFDGAEMKLDVGGYPRVVSKIKQLQTDKENTLTLNAGDTFQGTLYYSLFKGEADSELFNMVTWDALALGNHEFDDGDTHLASYLGDLNLDSSKILAANIDAPSGNVLENSWSPYTIKTYPNGEKVGIIGIDIVQKTKVSSNPSDEIVFNDEVATAQKYIYELEDMGINKIVLLTHVGLDNDKSYASQLDGVDIIIGGDSHSLMGDFSSVGLTSHDTNYPVVTTDAAGDQVCIAQAWQYNYIVGNLDVSFDENGVVTACEGVPTLVLGDDLSYADSNDTLKTLVQDTIAANNNLEFVVEDSATATKLATFSEKVDEQKATVIGSASEVLGHNRIPGDTYDSKNTLPLGSDIAPIVAKSFYDLSNRADACIQNAGGVRIAVENGNITMDTAYTLLPFSNTLFEIEMYGSEIKQVLEDAMTNYLDNGGSTGSFPYAYGLRYDVNSNNTANNRISNLEVKNRTTGAWSTIQDNTIYVIVTNDYIAAGRDGYTTFKTVQDERGEGVDTYLDYALSFVRYVETKTTNNEQVSKLPAEDHPIKSYNAVLKKVGSFETNLEGGSEIVAYDATSKRMFTTNGENNAIDIINIANPVSPTKVSSIDLSTYGTGVNSVAVYGGKVAVAMQDGNDTVGSKQGKGSIVFFDTDGTYQTQVTVGYLPDMVTFNEDGTKVIVANEGEPNDAYTVDPIGSIGIINMADYSYVDINFSSATLTSAYDGTAVRLGGTPSNDKAKDLEPEYITVSGNYAYITLQENNAMAKVNLTNNTLEYVKSYGAKSWAADSNNTLDIEEEGVINMKSYPALFGLYQPDSIASYTSNGETYLVTANEGDGREYIEEIDAADQATCEANSGFEWDDGDCIRESHIDEKKISKLDLDVSIADAYADENDLKVMVDLGDTDNDGFYEKLYTYGARSFSIWDADGDLVWDSGDEIEKKVAQLQPALFNQDEGEIDGRSGNKGAEPEALTVGTIDGKTYAFVGLERQNAIIVYDITIPTESTFVDYIETESAGDISPEGMKFVPSNESPNDKNLLLVSYEVSGSTVVYEVK